MQTTTNTYQARKKEIDLYFRTLENLYAENLHSEIRHLCTDDFLKILKSNALLMLYNLVESSIMSAILDIYDALKSKKLSYKNVRQEIQTIWFSSMFNQVYDKNAHHNSYKSKANEMINFILNDSILSLDRKAANISGNLDAQQIRDILKDHGIAYNLSEECKGGFALTDIKDKRNELAHGTISFVECGRNYSIDDLIEKKEQTILFLDEILKGMSEYYNNNSYLADAAIF